MHGPLSVATGIRCVLSCISVSPDEIKQLRSALKCTARELATTLELPISEIQAWEAGTLFPTKQWVTRLETLRSIGPTGITRKATKNTRQTPMQLLDNPELWQILRKLLAHPKLYSEVASLASSYDDPASKPELV